MRTYNVSLTKRVFADAVVRLQAVNINEAQKAALALPNTRIDWVYTDLQDTTIDSVEEVQ